MTWGVPTFIQGIVQALGAPLESGCVWRMEVAFCPNPPRNEEWPLTHILGSILSDQGRISNEKPVLSLASSSLEGFNHGALKYCLVRDFPGSAMTILSSGLSDEVSAMGNYREQDKLRQLLRFYNLSWLTADYLAYIPQLKNELYAKALVSFLDNPPAIFKGTHHEVAQFSLPNGWTVRLLKRTGPLTATEAEVSVGLLELPEGIKKHLQEEAKKLFL